MIIFHAPTHKGTIGNNLRTKVPKSALFAMVSMEQPNYAPTLQDLSYLQKHMNLMVTYSLSTNYPGTKIPNLPISYYPLHILSAQAILKPSRSFTEKTGYGTGE
jgi:hypothetical protein